MAHDAETLLLIYLNRVVHEMSMFFKIVKVQKNCTLLIRKFRTQLSSTDCVVLLAMCFT